MSPNPPGRSAWPELRFAEWRDSGATLQLWTQIVGKLRLALSPWLNHGWQVPLYISARGLGSSAMHVGGGRLVEVEFDLVDHRLVIRSSDAAEHGFALAPMSVAAFYRRFMAEIAAIGIHVAINLRPNEVADPIPFPDDETHAAYDPAAVHTVWRALVQADACSAISAVAFSARRARCICSGVPSTSRSRASRAGRHRCIRAASPACPTR